MKLRNKKTGEILEVFNNTDGMIPQTLAELCEEWEDYEEPKEFWHISCEGKINRVPYDEHCYYPEKEIGNYFLSKEEAGLAVRKLKAWKRLSSLSFKFKGWRTADLGADKYYFVMTAESDGAGKGDLDLLFEGKE